MRMAKAAAVVCILAGFLPVAGVRALSPPAPLGKLVDLGGHRLHVYCTGSGSPTVLVETGFEEFSFDWILVQQRVSRFTRICTYDRAGYGYSDPGPLPRTYAQINLEIHDVLHKLGEAGPFLLVGHSFGGSVVRNYAATYPAEVVGMVLVDIVSEDQRIPMGDKAQRVRDYATGKPIPPPHEVMLPSDRPKMNLPQPEAGPAKLEPPLGRLPPVEQRMHLWAMTQPSLEYAEASERDWSPEYMQKLHDTPQKGILGTRPLIVMTRAVGGYDHSLGVPASELEKERLQTQAALARLSKDGKQIIVSSGHEMEVEVPGRVAEAIREVVMKARK
jgi:pimeloyl-ACP methyl ester carboxylesterase